MVHSFARSLVQNDWAVWYLKNQVAGYFTTYSKPYPITFTTIKVRHIYALLAHERAIGRYREGLTRARRANRAAATWCRSTSRRRPSPCSRASWTAPGRRASSSTAITVTVLRTLVHRL